MFPKIRRKVLTMIAVMGAGLIGMTLAQAQEQLQAPMIAQENLNESTNEGNGSYWTRIAISTSGPAQFDSHWLEDQLKLVIEFRSRNILSQVDEEIMVNSGVIKRITSSYWGKADAKALKTLNFELSENVPYKIWQEDNTIFIAFPMSSLQMGKEGLEEQKAAKLITQRLEVMDNALTQISGNQQSTQRTEHPLKELLPIKVLQESGIKSEGAREVTEKIGAASFIPLPEEVRADKQLAGEKPSSFQGGKMLTRILMGFMGMAFLAGAAFWGIRRQRKNFEKRINKLTSELEKQGRLLQQEEIIRKAIEETSLAKDKEYEELKSSFDALKLESHQKEEIKKETEQAWLQKEIEYEELKDPVKSLKSELDQKDQRLTHAENELKLINQQLWQKQNDFQQLKSSFELLKEELDQNNESLRETEALLEKTHQALLQKQKDYEELKNSLESLKSELEQKEGDLALKENKLKEEQQFEKTMEGVFKEESPERRSSLRVSLTKDFHKTIIVRIESAGSSQPLKSFVNNINGGGFSFEAKSEFKENDRMNLRLFFYGDRVPIIKIQGRIIWKRIEGSNYRYGVCFESVKDTDRSELNGYLESKEEVVEDAMSLVS